MQHHASGEAGRSRFFPRGRRLAVVALALAGIGPVVALATLAGLARPLVASHWRCGTPDAMLAMMVPLSAVFTAGTAATLVGLSTRRGWTRVDRLLRVLAPALAAAASLVAGAAVVRLASRPAPEAYVRSLPIVARLGPVDASPAVVGDREVRPRTYDDAAETRDDEGGGVRVRRVCRAGECELSIARASGGSGEERGAGSVPASAMLFVRHDAARALWIVEDLRAPRIAFRERGALGFEIADVTVRDVASSVAPPAGWLAAAALAVAIAAALLLRRARVAGSRARLAAARPGALGDDGWIAFDDAGAPARLATIAPRAALAAGPVVVIGGAGGAPYRGDGGALVEVLPGSIADAVEAIGARAATHDALVVAALLLLATPLATCAAVGLVF